MVIKLSDAPCFLAGDQTKLRELANPSNTNVETRFSLAHAYLDKGEQSLPHKLVSSSET